MLANATAVHAQRWAGALAARGHEVTLLSVRPAVIPGVNVISFGIASSKAWGTLRLLIGYTKLLLSVPFIKRKLRPDVVNAHYSVTNGVIAALTRSTPRVINLWGSDVIWSGPGPMPAWRRWLIRFSIKGASHVVSTSKYMLSATQTLLENFPPSTIIPFGVNCSLFMPIDRTQRCHVTIGWVKTFSDRYAPDIFLRAAAIALIKDPTLRFIMAGHGPTLPQIKDLAISLGINKSVAFTGFLPNEAIAVLMQDFDIFVNSTRVNESFGVVLIEAAACGLPVISTDVGGVREAIIPDETALLVPPDDPAALATTMLLLATNEQTRFAMGEAGRRNVEATFQWQRSIDLQEAVLLSAIKKP